MTSTTRPGSIGRDALQAGGLVALGLVAMLVLGPDLQIQYTQWLVFGLLALSLSFVWGWGGIFSFGQTLFFGVSAYVYGVTGQLWIDVPSGLWLATAAAIAAGCLVAAALAYLMFYGGVTDVYVAVVTLAATLVAGTLLGATSGPAWSIGDVQLGGFNGLIGVPPLGVGETPLVGFALNVAIVAVIAVTYFGLRRYIASNAGHVAAATADNADRAELLGYDARRHRFVVFVIGAFVASAAGVLYSATSGIITPAVFNVTLAGSVIIWVMFGGRSVLMGGVVGAVLIGYLSDSVQYFTVGGTTPFASQTPLVLGLIMLLVVLFLPGGVLPAAAALTGRFARRRVRTVAAAAESGDISRRGQGQPPAFASDEEGDTATSGRLSVSDVTKRFGGLKAVDGVSLDVPARETRCLLGPNGAGKSSLFKVVTGSYAPTAGRISLDGRDITRLSTPLRARRGLGIKMQVPCIFPTLTVAENLWVAAFVRTRNRDAASQLTARMASWLGLEQTSDLPAGQLAHGDQQWLEMGMVLSTKPSVVLLDEPTAGMTSLETAQVSQLLHELKGLATIIVVEHDMEFVRMVDAPLTVMVDGAVFREGSIDMLSSDQELLDVYVGRGTHAQR
jgi:branched-chain amino acid transport system permease protein